MTTYDKMKFIETYFRTKFASLSTLSFEVPPYRKIYCATLILKFKASEFFIPIKYFDRKSVLEIVQEVKSKLPQEYAWALQ